MNELQGKRILVVEDNALNLAVFATVLKHSGAIVIQDYWNINTVSLVTKHLPVDAILLDLMLKHQTNGYSIFDELQTHPVLVGIPVIVVSAADPDTEIPKAKRKGMAGFIGKPINPIKFPRQVADCIDGSPVWYAPRGLYEE
jgi:two-component system cell cycle response regulator DivK